MKQVRVFFIVPVLIFTFLFNSAVIAQETPEVQSAGVLVASVNIQNATITSQEGNTFSIDFTMTNGKGVQSGIRYRARLLTTVAKEQVVTNEKIYDDVVFLSENASVQKSITYTVPAGLSGKYTISIDAQNEKGFPFAIVSLGEVTLEGAAEGMAIDPTSCSLVSGAQTYKTAPFQGIITNAGESLALTCSVKNLSDTQVSFTPSFETTTKTTFGRLAQAQGDTTAIDFAAGETKPVTFTLTTPVKPSVYVTNFSGTVNGVESNSIDVGYVVRGTIAAIDNISLDKESYAKGEDANLSVIWSVYTDDAQKKDSPITLTTTIKNSLGMSCAKSVSQALPIVRTEPTTTFVMPVTRNCANPVVSVTLADSEGTALDTQTLSFSAEADGGGNVKKAAFITLATLFVIVVVGLYVRWLRKHESEEKQQ